MTGVVVNSYFVVEASMGVPIHATWEERLAYMAKKWSGKVGRTVEDVLVALQTNPQCVSDLTTLLNGSPQLGVLFANYSGLRRRYQPDLPRGIKPRHKTQHNKTVSLPELDDAVRIITHYRTLVDRHAHLMDEVHKVEEEMKVYKPIAEGYETMRRKLDEVKENIAKMGPRTV